jgi:hypothetical protein
MIKSIDISHFEEESYIIDDLELIFSETGIIILSTEGIFSIESLEKSFKKIENIYILINDDKDELSITEDQYMLIENLIKDKEEVTSF